jgi:hypothetical protein
MPQGELILLKFLNKARFLFLLLILLIAVFTIFELLLVLLDPPTPYKKLTLLSSKNLFTSGMFAADLSPPLAKITSFEKSKHFNIALDAESSSSLKVIT